jgi:hypothetical protein
VLLAALKGAAAASFLLSAGRLYLKGQAAWLFSVKPDRGRSGKGLGRAQNGQSSTAARRAGNRGARGSGRDAAPYPFLLPFGQSSAHQPVCAGRSGVVLFLKSTAPESVHPNKAPSRRVRANRHPLQLSPKAIFPISGEASIGSSFFFQQGKQPVSLG